MGLMSMKNFKRFGFTLSEVMITITMIGVIATLTLSTIGASVQQRARAAEFRTAYAKAEEALRGLIFTDDRIYQCYECPNTSQKNLYGLNQAMANGCAGGSSSTACQELTTQFLRAMGRVRSCESNPRNEGCISGTHRNADCFSINQAYVLDNGMLVFTKSKNTGLREFAIDVNGIKGPNKWGQDIFTFSVTAVASSKTGNNVYVTDVKILPPKSCLPKFNASSKNSDELLKESASYN